MQNDGKATAALSFIENHSRENWKKRRGGVTRHYPIYCPRFFLYLKGKREQRKEKEGRGLGAV